MYSAADYLQQLQSLLPQGAAWARAPEAMLNKLLSGLAQEFARIDAKARSLIDEADPRTATELLEDWERVVGLPDACTPIAASIAERRLAVYQRIAALGGQNRAYYVGLAERLGYQAEILEYQPCRIGARIGDRLYGPPWAFAWLFATTPSLADGDPLGLACQIVRLKPAHTTVLFGDLADLGIVFTYDFLES